MQPLVESFGQFRGLDEMGRRDTDCRPAYSSSLCSLSFLVFFVLRLSL